jgi:signal transduction histidine kinase
VCDLHDITDLKLAEEARRQPAQRTQESLQSLLVLAEALVHLPTITEQGSDEASVEQWLVEHVHSVLDYRRAAITISNAQTGQYRSAAIVGVPEEIVRGWYERRPGYTLIEQLVGTPMKAQLEKGEVIVLDTRQPPFHDVGAIYGSGKVLLAPMIVGERMIGLLLLDSGVLDHQYTADELALAKAVSQLASLILERERLLTDRAEVQANVLALREANRMMDDFLGIAGHELRTPLTTTKASVQFAQRQLNRLVQRLEGLTPEIKQQFANIQGLLERAERHVGMQARLVSDLLDVSRIQADRLELNQQLFDLVAIVRESVADHQYLAPSRKLFLEDVPPGEMPVLADVDRIRQVISNYLSNALKYSEPDKPVAVRIEQVGACVRVLVRDKGPGLSQEQQQHIWERFYRVPETAVKTDSGVSLGLGLHICLTLIKRHGGQVGVESEPGKGSTFWFTLPLINDTHSSKHLS